jgi:ATP-binding cassette, subfamily B, bacterial
LNTLHRFRWTLAYLRPHGWGLGLVTAISLLSTALSLVQPYLSKLLIDEALLKRDVDALVRVSGLMIGSSLLAFLFNVAAGYYYTKISTQVLFAMRKDLLEHLHSLSPRFYAEWKTGDILSRLNNDISEIQRVVADALLSLLGNLGFLAGSVFILVRMDLSLFAVGVAVLPVAAWVAWWFRTMLVDRIRIVRERAAEIGSFLLNSLLGHRIVAAFGGMRQETAQFRKRNDSYVDALLRMQLLSYSGAGLPAMLLAASTAAVFWVGGNKVIAGTMTVGTLVAFLAYHMRLLGPVQALMGMYTNLVTAQVSLERVQTLFDAKPEVVAPAGGADLYLSGHVALENVTFAFGHRKVFESLYWNVPLGGIGVVLGPSGRGKSTLADLLLRFYDPQSGRVLIDGHDLKTVPMASLRKHVAVVEQSPWLFPASVAENLRYADPAASDADLHAALAAVGLDSAFPDLQTMVGERGLNLSAGQRQRLAIARALLRRPNVLVLDEPTAALDEASERIVTQGIRKFLPHATLILITHRRQLAELASSVLDLE